MGRHSADDGAGVDPLVAAALAQRPTGEPGAPRHESSDQRMLTAYGDGESDGELGWPGDPVDGTGLGWPVDHAVEPRAGERPVTLVSDAPVRRSRWRRLFGSSAA